MQQINIARTEYRTLSLWPVKLTDWRLLYESTVVGEPQLPPKAVRSGLTFMEYRVLKNPFVCHITGEAVGESAAHSRHPLWTFILIAVLASVLVIATALLSLVFALADTPEANFAIVSALVAAFVLAAIFVG